MKSLPYFQEQDKYLTRLWIKVPANYYRLLIEIGLGNKKPNPHKTFLFFDDFSNGLSKWERHNCYYQTKRKFKHETTAEAVIRDYIPMKPVLSIEEHYAMALNDNVPKVFKTKNFRCKLTWGAYNCVLQDVICFDNIVVDNKEYDVFDLDIDKSYSISTHKDYIDSNLIEHVYVRDASNDFEIEKYLFDVETLTLDVILYDISPYYNRKYTQIWVPLPKQFENQNLEVKLVETESRSD